MRLDMFVEKTLKSIKIKPKLTDDRFEILHLPSADGMHSEPYLIVGTGTDSRGRLECQHIPYSMWGNYEIV